MLAVDHPSWLFPCKAYRVLHQYTYSMTFYINIYWAHFLLTKERVRLFCNWPMSLIYTEKRTGDRTYHSWICVTSFHPIWHKCRSQTASKLKTVSLSYKVWHTETTSCLVELLSYYVSAGILWSFCFAKLHIYVITVSVWFSLIPCYDTSDLKLYLFLRSSQTMDLFQKHLRTYLLQSVSNSP